MEINLCYSPMFMGFPIAGKLGKVLLAEQPNEVWLVKDGRPVVKIVGISEIVPLNEDENDV